MVLSVPIDIQVSTHTVLSSVDLYLLNPFRPIFTELSLTTRQSSKRQ